MWLGKICRLCGQASEIMKPIFNSNEKYDSFELKLKKCLPLASFITGDLKPKEVCVHCYNKIIEFYNFIVIYEAADYEMDRIIYENSEKWYQETAKVDILEPIKTELLFDTSSYFNDQETNFYSLPSVGKPVEIIPDPEAIQNEINKVADKTKVSTEEEESNDQVKDKIVKNVIGKNDEKFKPFSCSVCNKQFARQTNVTLHILQQHSDSKPYKCKTCDRSFASSRELSIHGRLHTGDLKCPDCGRVFTAQSKLKRHIRIHTGEKPFVCTECNKGFNDKRNLETHKLLHTDERQFECETCHKKFRVKAHLVEHQHVHSKELGYTCDSCGKQFKWRANLNLHLQEHQGKVNQCKMCNVTFTRRAQLNKHTNRCEKRMEYLNNEPINENTNDIDIIT